MPQRKSNTRTVGSKGEEYAERLLKKKGYKILGNNYYTKAGEIDIVAQDGNTIVFIEVKLRRSEKFGLPEEAVTRTKLKRIKRAGQYFCLENKIKGRKMRIEVISLLVKNNELIRQKLIRVDSL